MQHPIGSLLTRLGVLTAHPVAFLVPAIYIALWFFIWPETLEWHAVVTLATLFMTLLIQRAEHRDTQAIHAKLDELLHAQHLARNAMTRVDDLEPEEIEKQRESHREND